MKKILIITCSPNLDGLTEACGKAAKQGAEKGKAGTIMARLNDLKISNCKACGNGWGTCNKTNVCQTIDDFQALHKLTGEVDGYIFITPVYFSEMSESLKAFFDRLRRCEAIKKEGKNKLEGKPYLAIAAAGGSGGGTVSTLVSMEKTLDRMRASRFDLLGITKKNREYMLKTIETAAENMAAAIEAK